MSGRLSIQQQVGLRLVPAVAHGGLTENNEGERHYMTNENGDHVGLKEYVKDIIHSEGELRREQLKSQENALTLAKNEIDRRLHEMNQMREQIAAERGIFVSRELHDQMEKLLADKIDSVNTALTDKIDGLNKVIYVGSILFLLNLIFALLIYFKR
jgi:hypothetical protein